jgi:[NiFe] hydrogenase assembly HybE family chaperone
MRFVDEAWHTITATIGGAWHFTQTFPEGSYTFIAGQLAGIGPLESCSLFSPMDEFDDPEVAQLVARHVLEELLREPAASNAATPAISRRNFLRGGSGLSRDKPPA